MMRRCAAIVPPFATPIRPPSTFRPFTSDISLNSMSSQTFLFTSATANSCQSASEAHIIGARERSSSCAWVFSTRARIQKGFVTKNSCCALTKPPTPDSRECCTDPFPSPDDPRCGLLPRRSQQCELAVCAPSTLLNGSSTLAKELTDLSRKQTLELYPAPYWEVHGKQTGRAHQAPHHATY